MVCAQADTLIKEVFYDHNIDTIKSIFTFEEDYTIMRVKQNDAIYSVQLGKTLNYMARHDFENITLASGPTKIILEASEYP
mmetsp:Transcript_16109/g.15505  ORF Transcript_16109/g.15505 Transcript_16109/m.15505 type:complete len:81 (+) Transcript_16109:42-284(+)